MPKESVPPAILGACPLCKENVLEGQKNFNGVQPNARGWYHWECYRNKHGQNDRASKEANLLKIEGFAQGKADKLRQLKTQGHY